MVIHRVKFLFLLLFLLGHFTPQKNLQKILTPEPPEPPQPPLPPLPPQPPQAKNQFLVGKLLSFWMICLSFSKICLSFFRLEFFWPWVFFEMSKKKPGYWEKQLLTAGRIHFHISKPTKCITIHTTILPSSSNIPCGPTKQLSHTI